MNKLQGAITAITTKDQFAMVSLVVKNQIFRAIVINVNAINPNLVIGQNVNILFKETDVTLSREIPVHISIDNQIPVIVDGIIMGDLLSKVRVSFQNIFVKTVVPAEFAASIKIGMSLTMLIRSNELMLME